MARKSREEKFLDYSEAVVKDLEKLYDDNGRAVIEYRKAMDEYKKLFKRFNKTINMNDSIGKSVIENNENLKGSLDYTISAAREKLLHNVSEHRKTKEKLSQILDDEKKSSKSVKSELDLAYFRISELEKQVEDLKKGKGSVTNVFEKRDNSGSKIDINLDEFKKFSYKDLLENEIKKASLRKTSLYLVKLTIDNFDIIKSQIEQHGSISGFLKGNVKFISLTIGKQAIVYYSHNNIIYIMFPNVDLETIISKLEKLKVKRKLEDINITFSMGLAEYSEDDNFETLNSKSDNLNEEASLDKLEGSLVYK